MRRKILIQTLLCLLWLPALRVAAQPLPFWNEIKAFKKADSIAQPPDNAILFVGSSSFRLWKDVQQAFPGRTIINRGFGGSSLPHVIQYADDIIFPYNPKQVVIYCGENDIAGSDSVTGEIAFQRFEELFTLIRNRLPDAHVMYVSMKPSPSRWHLKEKMEKGNELIKDFLRRKKQTAYVDVWNPMLDEDGKPKAELFLSDNLHMNEKGYTIWQKQIKPHLKK